MAAHPTPSRTNRGVELVESTPQVLVLHRLLGRGSPPISSPSLDPVGDAVLYVLRVGVQANGHGIREMPVTELQRFYHRRELHSIVGCFRLGPETLGVSVLVDDDKGPATRPRISVASAVGVHFDCSHWDVLYHGPLVRVALWGLVLRRQIGATHQLVQSIDLGAQPDEKVRRSPTILDREEREAPLKRQTASPAPSGVWRLQTRILHSGRIGRASPG